MRLVQPQFDSVREGLPAGLHILLNQIQFVGAGVQPERAVADRLGKVAAHAGGQGNRQGGALQADASPVANPKTGGQRMGSEAGDEHGGAVLPRKASFEVAGAR
jgi:hypothetical protein